MSQAATYSAAAPADPRLPPVLSSAQLSRRFCLVARYLMESPAPGAAAHDVQPVPSSSRLEAPHEGLLYGRLSFAATGNAAKALLSHPQPEVAQRYIKQLCDLACSRLQMVRWKCLTSCLLPCRAVLHTMEQMII